MSKVHADSEFDETTLVDDGRDNHHGMSFHSGVPKENRTNNDRLAERALLQGAKSGLLDDRVSVDAEESEF